MHESIRLLFGAMVVSIALCGCGQLAPGTGDGFVEPVEHSFSFLSAELLIRFPDVLRPARFFMKADRGPFGEYKYLSIHGFIPISDAFIKGRDICNRRQDPYCKSIALGEEVLRYPEKLNSIKSWIINFCDELPERVDEKGIYYDVAKRQREVSALRVFMGCSAEVRPHRAIHLHVVRNFDDVFGIDVDHTDRMLPKSLLMSQVLIVN